MIRKVALAALAILLLTIPLTVSADVDKKDLNIPAGDNYSDSLLLLGQGNSIKVTVTSNSSIDVYVLSTAQYSQYAINTSNFTPTYRVLSTKSITFSWKQPDSDFYTLVIDNAVNGIGGSADPAGPVVVSYHRTGTSAEQAVENAFAFASLLCIAVVVVGAIIVVVIIVLILKRKKGPSAPAIHPQYMTPQPGYGQPQYCQPQPPPGQYSPPPPPPQSQYPPPPPPGR